MRRLDFDLKTIISEDRKSKIVYPKDSEIFRALELCPLNKTRVIILGQDPYHQVGQANGLAFSVNEGVRLPPSLKNIFVELQDDLGIKRTNGDLTGWAKQGVLLLNCLLTVEDSKPLSYPEWETVTDDIIAEAASYVHPKIFVLWGKYAHSKQRLIHGSQNFIIKGAHPSPLSAYNGFFGKKYFSRVNAFLKLKGFDEIDWSL